MRRREATIPWPSWQDAARQPAVLLAFGLGSGLLRPAPGTWGTLAAAPVYWWGLSLLQTPLYWLAVAAAFLAGVWLCGHATKSLGTPDHPGIVWDEWVGFWITMGAAPAGAGWLVAGFLVFRFFDIWKPWPIRWADRHVPGGFGIMLDDALAGVFGAVALYALNILAHAA